MSEFRLLGSLELTAADGSQLLSVLSQPKRVSILAYLAAASPRGFHRRDTLLALFWPEADEEHGRSSLRQALHFLRKSLGDAAVPSRGDEDVRIDTDHVWCDVVAFDDAIDSGNLSAALSLYRGDLLAGFHLSDSPAFGHWADSERKRLRDRAVAAGEQLRDEASASGSLPEAAEFAHRVVDIAPANGQAVRELVRILSRRGDRAGAIDVYESFVERIEVEFGMEPLEELVALIDEIRSGSHAEGSNEAEAPVSPTVGFPAGRAPERPTSTGSSLIAVSAGTPDNGTRGSTARNAASRPFMVALVAALLLLAYAVVRPSLVGPEGGEPPPDILVVWVQPVIDLSLGQTLTELTLGLTEELQRAIGGSGQLDVLDLEAIGRSDEEFDRGRMLYMVSSTVRHAGDSLRVSVQLIARQSELQVWSNAYDLPMGPRASDQASLADMVAQQIEREVSSAAPVEAASQSALEDQSSPAFLPYWAGIALWVQRDPRSFMRAADYFRQAIDLDSAYAPFALAAIADVFNLAGAFDYGLLPPREAIPQALDAAREALALEPLAKAHASLGLAHLSYDWDPEAALVEFRAAIALDSDYTPAHHWLSLLLMVEGRKSESLLKMQEVLRLDPASALMSSGLARNYYYRGEYRLAINQFRHALLLDADFSPAYAGLGLSQLLNGQPEEAMEAYEDAEGILGPAPAVLALKGHLLGMQGDLQGARDILASLENHPLWVPSEYRAIVYLGMGDVDRALDSLDEAFLERSGAMVFLHTDPILSALVGHPRFEALIDAVGVAPR